jgi:glycosyltransferase involved in cell wall biosynthesis
MPLVTVLIPTLNAAPYIGCAISSIRKTYISDYEIVVVDGGSVDRTIEIARAYKNVRIVEAKKGIVNQLNFGIENSDSKFIIRMDADDISVPFRIDRQIGYLSRSVAKIVGSNVLQFKGLLFKIKRYPRNLNDLIYSSLFRNPLCHPSTAIRRDYSYRYEEGTDGAEDYALWLKYLSSDPTSIHNAQLTKNNAVDVKLIRQKIISKYAQSLHLNGRIDSIIKVANLEEISAEERFEINNLLMEKKVSRYLRHEILKGY